MFGIGPTELLVVLVVALLVLGPKRLPDMAKSLGRGLAEFRSATAEMSEELDNARIMLEEEARQSAKTTASQKRRDRASAAKERGNPSKNPADDTDDTDESEDAAEPTEALPEGPATKVSE